MGRFKTVKEVRAAAREVLADDMTLVCIRYDEYEPGWEVVSFDPKGIYWMLKFYDDGNTGLAAMDWASNMQFI